LGKIITTDVELSVHRWVQQRLAFLVKEPDLFSELENIKYKDYQGKFVVYYKMERKGRLFDFVEGVGENVNKHKFVFPADISDGKKDLVTGTLTELDDYLASAFKARVAALKSAAEA
jgi:hypothetical protein